MKARRYKWLIIIAVMTMMMGMSHAQGTSACPGFLNPTTFSTGSSVYFWSARVGERCYPTSNNDTTTGYYVMSTCASPLAPPIIGHNNIVSTTYNSGTDGGINCCNDGSLWDAMDCRFKIITQDDAGLDQFTINNGVGMPRIPPGYQTSIRLGDPRATGQSPNDGTHNWSSSHSNRGSEALFYTMRVTSQNALLFVNYAVVGRCYNHSAREAGEFLIRVVRQNEDGSWPNTPVNDSLWFKVSAPALPSNNQPVAPWVMGRPGSACSSTTCGYVYKPWTKVAINLNEYLYDVVRIEMYTSDCIYNVDPIYAYICGDFQPMALLATGCPDPESNVIDTLIAPEGMISYRWLVSCDNAEPREYFLNNAHMDSVHFRQIYPATGTTDQNVFAPSLEHFLVTEGENIGDTVGEKTFLCIMTSAMDPAKPFESKLYVNVTNTRPIMAQRHEALCDGTVNFINESRCIGSVYIESDSTTWTISLGDSVVAVLVGDLASYRFTEPGNYTCVLNCKSTVPNDATAGCRAELTFPVTPIVLPKLEINAPNTLCDGDTLTAVAVGMGDMPLQWFIDGEEVSTAVAVKQVLPLGMHTLTLVASGTDSCSVTVEDTVTVYGTPVISGPDAICYGDTAVITAAGGAVYQWQADPEDPALAAQQGNATITVSPAATTLYTLLPDPGNPCSAGGADIRLEVLPTPVPAIWVGSDFVNAEHPVLALTDISPNRYSTTWHFSDGQTMEGESVRYIFSSVASDSVHVTMHTCNRLDCCADTTVSRPVVVEGVWVPNVFTPGEDINNRFTLVSSFPLLDFELFIYDRNGQMVFSTTDTEGWDGNDQQGRPCRQGAYTYRYRFSKYGPDHHTGVGTVTLIR